MLTKNINFTNYLIKGNQSKIRNKLNSLLSKNLAVLTSLKASYQNSYKKKFISKLKNYTNIRIIGMGGSILGAEAIHDFLKFKIIKNFSFINNLSTKNYYFKNNKKNLNIIISKSGNTLETISNVNILIKKKDKNIFITENKKSYLRSLANKLKSEIINHNNFIGGRYSVLSEVGMLPAELMGLKEKKFKQFNNLIKNKYFINSLISNVSNKIFFLKKKKYNSIIFNYDEKTCITLFTIKPGEQTGWHRHENDYVALQQSEGRLHLDYADGTSLDIDYSPGKALPVKAPVEHNAINVGDVDIIALEIEYKAG